VFIGEEDGKVGREMEKWGKEVKGRVNEGRKGYQWK
jgi:hypothetical protein